MKKTLSILGDAIGLHLIDNRYLVAYVVAGGAESEARIVPQLRNDKTAWIAGARYVHETVVSGDGIFELQLAVGHALDQSPMAAEVIGGLASPKASQVIPTTSSTPMSCEAIASGSAT